ncbi:calcium-transporting ATPase 1-like protein, partial [Tanacetum coccineum]
MVLRLNILGRLQDSGRATLTTKRLGFTLGRPRKSKWVNVGQLFLYNSGGEEMETEFYEKDPMHFEGYTLIRIVGIKDPVHPCVKESVAICRSAGITVRMVTGDNMHTAKAIARECGILTDDGIAIKGPDFREKTEEELFIPKIQVLARSSQMDMPKLMLVRPMEIGRKLSLNASRSNAMESDFEMKEVPSNTSISKPENHEPNQDSKYMPFETVMNSDHDQDKTPPIISSKKLCLSRKSLQKEVPDSTKRLDDLMPSDLDVQKENL